MRVRAIRLLACLPDSQFINEIATGLALIAEHVAELELAVSALTASGRWRGSEAVRVVADEEAAKYLILLDAVRCDRHNQSRKSGQLARFTDHLAKGIYANAAEYRPASFGELRGLVDQLRQSHYLDGPNDLDWIFRNEVDASREARLYTDYVETDQGSSWHSPQACDVVTSMFSTSVESSVVRLVAAMTRAGFTKPSGLRLVAAIWRGFEPDESTRWAEVAKRNQQTLAELGQGGLTSADFSDIDARLVVETWGFPLHGAELNVIKVDVETLREQQRNWRPDL